MARLLQIFGFLSVLFRGATLTFQSLTAGGILFLLFIFCLPSSEGQEIRSVCLRWFRRFALALAGMQMSYMLANTLILMQSAGLTFSEVSGANFVLAGAISIASSLTIAALSSEARPGSSLALPILAGAIVLSSVLTSHAMARLDYRF